MIPATLGHYRIVRAIGAGGMGEVFMAEDARLGRKVALKVLPQALASDPERRGRFEREARAVAALNHPNIITIYSVEEQDAVLFMTMELVEGTTLAELLAPQGMPIEQVLRVVVPLADAIGAAHQRGITHRDLKPGNVMVSAEGRVKVLDFGLAKLQEQTSADNLTTSMPGDRLTVDGRIMGTVAYMSPEQAAAGEVGPSSDIFSFGVLAYELLTGQLPFKGQGPAAMIGAMLSGRYTPLREVRQDVPVGLAAVVERCLRIEPEARFQSGTELARALRSPLDGTDSLAVTTADSRELSPIAATGQEIRFCTTSDGVSLAYSVIGSGPFIVRVLGHFTHLEMEWEWADLRRFWEHLAVRHTVVRYDGRGMGLSDPYTGDFTEETRQLDLEAVLAAAGADRAALLGISEGGWTAAIYASQHVERISHLILYGAYCRGAQARPGYDAEEDRALLTLIRKGWGRDTPAFRQVFTSQFFRADADPALLAHFNELQRVSADGETAARYYESCHRRGDGRELYRQLRVPTLVVHSRDDLAVSADEGRLLASVIPGAQLVLLPSGTHYFPASPDVVTKVAGAIDRFLHGSGS